MRNSKFYRFLSATWELPQNVVGAIVVKLFKAKYCGTFEDASVYCWKVQGGMSLGKYIFVPNTYAYLPEDTLKRLVMHEYGHTIQSKYLGWFYLLVIGLPSLIWAWCFAGYRKQNNKSYYDFYTEKWADKLGGVERKNDNE